MCRRINCSNCGKPDWRGCGAHIEQVLSDVPPQERCQCRENGDLPEGPGFWGSLKALFSGPKR